MAARQIPGTFRKLVVSKLSTNFREAVEIVSCAGLKPSSKELLIRNRYVGVNASDINFSAGRYNPSQAPPFDIGFESVGEIVSVGESCKQHYKVGEAVAYMKYGAFSEYQLVAPRHVHSVTRIDPGYVTLLVSGMTAAISLDKVGELKSGETVLVTAAAGGTGQFAVQLAKLAGCHVIGTCSSEDKVRLLKNLGCDRPINYKVENLNKVLKREYPTEIDVVYESVGGEVFDVCVNRLAPRGRIIVIGYISGYTSSKFGSTSARSGTLIPKLLTKSASVRGFFLFNYAELWKEYFSKLAQLYDEGKLIAVVDGGFKRPHGPFKGLDSIFDAVEYLYKGENQGKIVVELPDSPIHSKL